MAAPSPLLRRIAFQGSPGAYSDLACRAAFPDVATLACPGFADAVAAVVEGHADRAMIPVENSQAGRVAEVHDLMRRAELHIVAEHFQRVNHQLMAPRGATLAGLRAVRSHIQGLSQCRRVIRELGLAPLAHPNTAGAARDVAAAGDPAVAAIGSALAAEIYGLDILRPDVEDQAGNTTRFLVLARSAERPDPARPCITSMLFHVRNLPAGLYKALGGFATHGVNLTRLESYMVEGRFAGTEFAVDAEGHPEQPALAGALDELRFFARELKILGTYPASPFRTAPEVEAHG